MAKKEYKSGTKEYYLVNGEKRNRKKVDSNNKKYKEKTYSIVRLLIRKEETEVLEKLESVDSKTKYIVDLIKKDIKASKD